MRNAVCFAVLSVLVPCTVTTAQTPGVVYSWAGVPSTTQEWQVWGNHNFLPGFDPPFNRATISGATGDLVVTETGTGNEVGGATWILDGFDRPREGAPAKGALDTTGLDYIEIDLKHNSPTATVQVDFLLQALLAETVTVYGGSNGVAVVQDFVTPSPPAWSIGPGLNTIRFPVSQLTRRQQATIQTIWLAPQRHAAAGNLTWTISEVRTVGTALAERNIVTNDAGSPDDGIDGAFALNPDDMLAIVGNVGAPNQQGLARNPSGSGSLQWTDKGGTGDPGSESGATIGWGNGAGWRSTQPGDPATGNSYNERIADFSNYDRMTVRISAQDAMNPAGMVGIEGIFRVTEFDPTTVLASQNLRTDGEYHELEYDLSSVTFLKNVWHWGLDVAPHPNNIVFNIDNIRLWNSTAMQGVAGDYNDDGTVDAADYVLWRKGGSLQNDPTPGNQASDYDFWRSRFGATAGSGGATTATVPEPAAATLLLMSLLGVWLKRGARV